MTQSGMARVMLRHAMVLAFFSAPVALLVFGVIRWAGGHADGQPLAGLLLDLTVLFPGVALLAAMGAVPFSLALLLVPAKARTRKLAVAALAPLALLPCLVFPARALLVWPPFAVAVVVGLAVLVALAVYPDAAGGRTIG